MKTGDILRRARLESGVAQLHLALRLGVSQRHVSFVESNRSRPSRELILRWMREVGAAPPVVNAALLTAGLAPAFAETEPDNARLASACAALRRLLEVHEPYPALVFDADWIMAELNRGGQWLCSILLPEAMIEQRGRRHGIDMIATLAHPDGLLSRIRDPWAAGGALLDQLRSEQWVRPGLRARIDAYEASLVARFGKRPAAGQRAAGEPCLNLVFDTDFGPLAFFTIQAVFALPQDVTLASLRVELWFPADDATRAVLVRQGGSARAEVRGLNWER